MNVKKQSIFLILLAALLVGFIGAYTAVKVTEPNTNTEQKQDQVGKTKDNTEESAELSTEVPEDMTKVTQAYNLIQEHYVEDVDEKELLEGAIQGMRSEEHTSELQSRGHLVCRLRLEKKKRTGGIAKRRTHMIAKLRNNPQPSPSSGKGPAFRTAASPTILCLIPETRHVSRRTRALTQ